ncbi:unnamed protein product [Somion occarium]|uniref:Protein kinase domain-containing protein n=1 Tax=Somion occarium TaxID=3059160 RepID=A0ABP1CW76_9APHY
MGVPYESAHSPQAPSPLIPDDLSEVFDSHEAKCKLWSSLESWFMTRGYFLYPRDPHLTNMPSTTTVHDLSSAPVHFPYAYVIDATPKGRVFTSQMHIFPAVNEQHRDVIIKLLRNDSPEYNVYKHITAEDIRSGLHRTGFDCLRTVFDFSLSILKALAFLHSNLVAYRDIKIHNILVNLYNGDAVYDDCREFYASQKARFVLCDFDLSVIFPPDTPPAARVCPASESDWGSYRYHPPDAADGQTVYDPFAYDVACLGGLLCELIGHLTPLVPMFAPFLDRMITPNIVSRYTALEALEALERLKASLDPEYLNTPASPPPQPPSYVWQAYDRWADLPEDFVREHTTPEGPVRPRRKELDDDWNSYFVDWNAPSLN